MLFVELRQAILADLSSFCERREAKAICDELLMHFCQTDKSDFILQAQKVVSDSIIKQLEEAVKALKTQKPLQYITGQTFFYDSKFEVDENVLIPRPETEELVHWVVEDYKNAAFSSILDIGTGSGCIPISLKKAMPHHQVSALDVSNSALALASRNAERNNVAVQFDCIDILNENQWEGIDKHDVIISNPPYIPFSEKTLMKNNVLDFEPHLALFVEDDNALIFYEKIAQLATHKLNKGGKLYFECNEYNAHDVWSLLAKKGFEDIVLRQDMSGRDRMIKATLKE